MAGNPLGYRVLAITVLCLAAVTWVPAFAAPFGFVTVPWTHWLGAFACGCALLLPFEALKRALDGHLGGAAIDTWAEEPTTADNPLRNHPKVIPSGHNVGHSTELYENLTPAGVANLSRGAVGRLPLYLRNPEVKPAARLLRLRPSG